MENHLIVEDWGLIVYAEAWQRQEELFNQRLPSRLYVGTEWESG